MTNSPSDQPERPAQRRGRGAPGHRARQLEPGAVAERAVGVEEEAERPADQQPRQGVAHVDRLGVDQLDVQVQAEQRAQGPGQGQVVGLAEVGPAARIARAARATGGVGPWPRRS